VRVSVSVMCYATGTTTLSEKGADKNYVLGLEMRMRIGMIVLECQVQRAMNEEEKRVLFVNHKHRTGARGV
jgi:hypothetical protein